MSEEESRPQPSIVPDVAASAFAALVGYGVGDASGAVLANALGPLLARILRRALPEWRRNAEVALEAAADSAQLPPEEFLSVVENDPRLSALALRVLESVRFSANERKIRALGALLGGEVARRGERVDEALLLADAVSQLEAPHVLVLEAMEVFERREHERRAATNDPNDKKVAWFEPLAEISGLPNHVVQLALATLVRSGALSPIPAWDVQGYELSEAGRAVLEVLRSAS